MIQYWKSALMEIGGVMRALLSVLTSVVLATSIPAAAQTPKAYFCEVTNIYELSDAGALQPVVSSSKKGDHFQIDIKTGEMTGTPLFSSNNWPNISVLDFGTSPSGSFLKVMYSSPHDREFVNVGYLEIQGTIKDQSRPFIYEEASALHSGVCRPAF
jgi:hypothetical protein